MKYLCLCILFSSLIFAPANAQLKKVADEAALKKRLEQVAETVKSIESDFIQI